MTSKQLSTPTEISLVHLPSNFCIPSNTLWNKDEKRLCRFENTTQKQTTLVFIQLLTGVEQQVGLRETWRMTNSNYLFQMLRKGNFEQTHCLFNMKALYAKLYCTLQPKKEPVNRGCASSYKKTVLKTQRMQFYMWWFVCRYLILTQRLLLHPDSTWTPGLKIDCQRLKSKALKGRHVILPQVLQYSWFITNKQNWSHPKSGNLKYHCDL